MRDVTELTELEADLVNRAIKVYPGALGYHPDRDPAVYEVAVELIEEGRIERQEVDDGVDPVTGAQVDQIMVGYRLTDEYAEAIRRTAAEKAAGADWN
jgi:hypothetical protein